MEGNGLDCNKERPADEERTPEGGSMLAWVSDCLRLDGENAAKEKVRSQFSIHRLL